METLGCGLQSPKKTALRNDSLSMAGMSENQKKQQRIGTGASFNTKHGTLLNIIIPSLSHHYPKACWRQVFCGSQLVCIQTDDSTWESCRFTSISRGSNRGFMKPCTLKSINAGLGKSFFLCGDVQLPGLTTDITGYLIGSCPGCPGSRWHAGLAAGSTTGTPKSRWLLLVARPR